MRYLIVVSLLYVLGGCGQTDGITRDTEAFAEIAEGEVITAAGTEPFWTIDIADGQATLSTPEHLEGMRFEVSRFAGNNGLGFSGELDGRQLVLTITSGICSDGMSDRSFPYTATLALDEEIRQGCAYTDVQGFEE